MLQPYDENWPSAFESAAAEIRDVTDASWVIEHIGSTAVPGLIAKPITDLAVRVDHAANFEQHQGALAEARERGGYNAGKTAIIQELVDAARAARGLPSVPVYDKD